MGGPLRRCLFCLSRSDHKDPAGYGFAGWARQAGQITWYERDRSGVCLSLARVKQSRWRSMRYGTSCTYRPLLSRRESRLGWAIFWQACP